MAHGTGRFKLRVKVIGPLATHPLDETNLRVAVDGEECTVVKRGLADGQLLIRMKADGFLAIVNRDELEWIG